MKIEKCKDLNLIQGSKQYFEADPKLDKLYVSPDGQYFKKYNDTVFHCSKLGTQATLISREMANIKEVKKVSQNDEKGQDQGKKTKKK